MLTLRAMEEKTVRNAWGVGRGCGGAPLPPLGGREALNGVH